MRWPDGLRGWPHRETSRRVAVAPHRWHVQEMGPDGDDAPTLLLIHGAGGASHSWRGVLPILAERFHVIALDKPGHGMTQMGSRVRSGLNAMSEDILHLCREQDWHPTAVVGHSAGGAVALRMAQLDPDRVPRVLGINPALGKFKGLAGMLFPVMAKALAMTPFTADIFSRSAMRPGRVEALLDGTGSRLDPQGKALYRALVADRGHVDGALTMMAQWNLDALHAHLRETRVPVRFLTGSQDRTVPPDVAREIAGKLPDARVTQWDGLGHLMHEEAPARVCDWIVAALEASENEESLPRAGQAS
jgi:magnesium chelatase accessory protein